MKSEVLRALVLDPLVSIFGFPLVDTFGRPSFWSSAVVAMISLIHFFTTLHFIIKSNNYGEELKYYSNNNLILLKYLCIVSVSSSALGAVYSLGKSFFEFFISSHASDFFFVFVSGPMSEALFGMAWGITGFIFGLLCMIVVHIRTARLMRNPTSKNLN